MSVSVARASLGMVVLAACGSGEQPLCPLDKPGAQSPYCGSAMMLALRQSEELVLPQHELDLFYELQKPAWTELPILRLTGAANDSVNTPTQLVIQSVDPAVVEAWSAGDVRVGEQAVDRWFADAGADAVVRLAIDSDGLPTFAVHYELPVSWRVLEASITGIPDTRLLPDHQQPVIGGDITLSWDGADAIFTFVVAWGDCFVGCAGTHTWQARVTPDRQVGFSDLGGDPVPAYLEQTAANRPPPR